MLHARTVVHDNEQVFVTSANLTPNALDRNIEAGVLVRDRSLAHAVAAYFQRLIDTSLVVPLPPVPSAFSHTTLLMGKRGGRWG